MFDRTRRTGYRVLSVLNDLNAISRGPKAIAKRFVRKAIYREISRLQRKSGL